VTAENKSFGETAILTPANAITVGRLLLTPVFIWMVVHWGAVWPTAGIGALVAFSDNLDGYVARKMGSTRSGAFLDPLIDKIVVLACFITLGVEHKVPWAAIAIIAAREIWMTWYRWSASNRGISIPARATAKVKTMVQDFAIAFVVLPWTANLRWLQLATIWLAVALTVYTGIEYWVDGRRVEAALHHES
jgi:CDP-diacylglycerol--glycerol-3-phosphate 3-phosphatidyltransferase